MSSSIHNHSFSFDDIISEEIVKKKSAKDDSTPIVNIKDQAFAPPIPHSNQFEKQRFNKNPSGHTEALVNDVGKNVFIPNDKQIIYNQENESLPENISLTKDDLTKKINNLEFHKLNFPSSDDFLNIDKYFAVFLDEEKSTDSTTYFTFEDSLALAKRSDISKIIFLVNEEDKQFAWTSDSLENPDLLKENIVFQASPNNKEENQVLDIDFNQYEHVKCDGDELRSFIETVRQACVEHYNNLDNLEAPSQSKKNNTIIQEKPIETNLLDDRPEIKSGQSQEKRKTKNQNDKEKLSAKQKQTVESNAKHFQDQEYKAEQAKEKKIAQEMDKKADNMKAQDQAYGNKQHEIEENDRLVGG